MRSFAQELACALVGLVIAGCGARPEPATSGTRDAPDASAPAIAPASDAGVESVPAASAAPPEAAPSPTVEPPPPPTSPPPPPPAPSGPKISIARVGAEAAVPPATTARLAQAIARNARSCAERALREGDGQPPGPLHTIALTVDDKGKVTRARVTAAAPRDAAYAACVERELGKVDASDRGRTIVVPTVTGQPKR